MMCDYKACCRTDIWKIIGYNPAMLWLAYVWEMLLHTDSQLSILAAEHGVMVYAILFAIIFVETGLVVMPFLPGDSLLFVAGALAARGTVDVHILIAVLAAAAILGDSLNYAIGSYFGPKVFQWENSRFFNKKAFDKAHAFYEKYGGITIIIARFMPFIRTFAPFVAGVAQMTYAKFLVYNVVGGILWVASLSYAGYFFGNIPWVQTNLTLIIIGIVVVSLLPIIYAAVKNWRASRKNTF